MLISRVAPSLIVVACALTAIGGVQIWQALSWTHVLQLGIVSAFGCVCACAWGGSRG